MPRSFLVLLRAQLLIAMAAAGGCASLGPLSPLRPMEQAIVFQPAVHPAGDWSPAGLKFEDVWFESEDGTRLHGWLVDHPQPRGVALFCHGNGGNVTVLAELLQTLNSRHRLAVMTFDYRGYGRSAGQPSETGVIQDARAARKKLAERMKLPERDIILMGQSLGGAVAVDLAAADGARALVLSSTFTSLPAVGASHLPWLLPRWNMTMRMDSLAKIERYQGPVLISHGDADEVIPFSHGEALYAAVPGPKRFYREPGGKHNDPGTAAYRQVLEEFLASLDQPRRAPAP